MATKSSPQACKNLETSLGGAVVCGAASLVPKRNLIFSEFAPPRTLLGGGILSYGTKMTLILRM